MKVKCAECEKKIKQKKAYAFNKEKYYCSEKCFDKMKESTNWEWHGAEVNSI